MSLSSLRVCRSDTVAAFAERAEPFLLRNEAAHNLILGITADLFRTQGRSSQPVEPPYLATVEAGDQVVAAAVRTPPYNLVLSVVEAAHADRVVDLLVRDVV